MFGLGRRFDAIDKKLEDHAQREQEILNAIKGNGDAIKHNGDAIKGNRDRIGDLKWVFGVGLAIVAIVLAILEVFGKG